MYKKTLFALISIVISMIPLCHITQVLAATPEQQANIRAERMQLEATKKKMLLNCEQFKDSNPESYTRCVKEYTARHEMNVRLLMREPETYFAKKAAGTKNN